MATADSSALSELLTQLYERPFENLVDQGSEVWSWLPKQGISSDQARWKMQYAGNSSVGFYSELGDLGVADHQYYKPAALTMRFVKVVVQVSGVMQAMTQGEGGYREAWSSEVEDGLDNLKTLVNDTLMSTTAAASSGLAFDGIPGVILNSGVYAGIDSGTYTWWQSYIKDASAAAVSVALLQDVLRNVRQRPRRGRPSIIFCDLTQFDYYGNTQTGLRRYQPQGKMDGGFAQNDLDFAGIPVRGIPSYPAQRFDFLDGRDWKFRTLVSFKAEPLDQGNVDARRQYFKMYGNTQCKRRNRQAALKNVAA
jgi:hypothetical protein